MNKKLLIGLVGVTLLSLSTNNKINILAAKKCTTQEECDAIIKDAQQEISSIKNKQNQVKTEINLVEADISVVYEQIELNENKINTLIGQIAQLESDILANEQRLAQLEIEIAELKEIVYERMRVSQRLSKTNTFLDIISETNSMVDLIKQLNAINRFAQKDEDHMKKLKEMVTEQKNTLIKLNQQKQELSENKANLEIERSNLEQKKRVLATKKAELAEKMKALESERLSASEIIKIAEEQKKFIVQQTSGGFMIPLQHGYVSCEFQCYVRADGTYHEGIDLANHGDTSTPVLASAAGTVIRSGWHSAYGWHVMISHNINGKIMTTVYGHMHTKPYVSVGQQVSKGQQIGTMGTTGNSTGPHLHFEMYEGYYNWPYGVNPRKYIHFPNRW